MKGGGLDYRTEYWVWDYGCKKLFWRE